MTIRLPSVFKASFLLVSSGLIISVAAVLPIAQAQSPVANSALRTDGLVASPRTLTAAQLAALPRHEQRTTDKEGRPHLYQGEALRDVLHLAGAPEGKAMHGAILRSC